MCCSCMGLEVALERGNRMEVRLLPKQIERDFFHYLIRYFIR